MEKIILVQMFTAEMDEYGLYSEWEAYGDSVDVGTLTSTDEEIWIEGALEPLKSIGLVRDASNG